MRQCSYDLEDRLQAAESRNDFVHKFSICLKELRESRRWLQLAQRLALVSPLPDLDWLLGETDALIKIFAKSIQTARRGPRTSN